MPSLSADDFQRLVTLFVPETITAMAFSPDGALLAVAAADKVHIFRVPPQARSGSDSPPATRLP
jgi:hypothetical protein